MGMKYALNQTAIFVQRIFSYIASRSHHLHSLDSLATKKFVCILKPAIIQTGGSCQLQVTVITTKKFLQVYPFSLSTVPRNKIFQMTRLLIVMTLVMSLKLALRVQLLKRKLSCFHKRSQEWRLVKELLKSLLCKTTGCSFWLLNLNLLLKLLLKLDIQEKSWSKMLGKL